MSALSNDPFTLARFTGVFKAVQSAGAAGAYGMDAVLTPLINEHLGSWILMLCTFIPTFFVIRTVKETNYEIEDVAYADDVKDHEKEQHPVETTPIEAPVDAVR